MGVVFDSIYKSYNDQIVLSDFSLELPEKGIACLFGPSGAGKTTVLNIAAGLVRPDRGMIGGLEGKSISYVFQEDRLLPWLNAKANIHVAKELDLQEIMNLLKMVELDSCPGKMPDELSGGMKRRLAIARALAYDGDIFLLDEAFRGLDTVLKKKVAQLFIDKSADRLIIMVTHDIQEALEWSDVLYLMEGPPLRIIKRLEKPYNIDEIISHAGFNVMTEER